MDLHIIDTVSVVDTYQVHLPVPFIDTDTLAATIKVFPIIFNLLGDIIIIVVVE